MKQRFFFIQNALTGLFFLNLFMLLPVVAWSQQVTDSRNIVSGSIIPDKSYSDQSYIIKTDDGAWLCVLTTGSGREGATGQNVVTQWSLCQL